MSEAPPYISNQTDVQNPFQKIARASWIAPLLGLLVNFLRVMFGGVKPDRVDAAVSVIFIGGGLLLGIIALFGIPKYGRKRILVPALCGIGIPLALVVLALPNFFAARKRMHGQAPPNVAMHSESARLLKDEKLRFSMDVPNGFVEFPEGKRTPATAHVFIKRMAGETEPPMVIQLEVLQGLLQKTKPLALEDFQKRMPPGVVAEYSDKNWRGIKVDAFIATLEQSGMRLVICTVQIPLVPSAIQLGVVGPESRRTEVELLCETLLASFDGKTNW